MFRQLIFFGQAIGFVGALNWNGAKSTDSASSLATVSAIPSAPTSAPRFELMKRDNWPPNYCGFVGGISSEGVTCSSHSSCVWNTDYYIVGCCGTTSVNKICQFFTSCVDINSPSTVTDDPLVYTCRGLSTCYENRYASNYHQWGCGYNATDILSTFSGMITASGTIQQAFIGTKELLNLQTVTQTIVQTVTMTATSAPTTTTVVSGPAKPSTGTIVGASVGSVALLVLGASAIAFLALRHRKNANVHQEPAPAAAQNGQGMTSPSMAPSTMTYAHSVDPSVAYSPFPKDQYAAMSYGLPNTSADPHFSNGSQYGGNYPQRASEVPGDGNYSYSIPGSPPPTHPGSPPPHVGEMDGAGIEHTPKGALSPPVPPPQ